jgi:hypothetical protein
MTIVLFCPNILRNYFKELFSLERLLDEGYNIIILDATKFYGHSSTANEEVILENRIECETIDDFFRFRENLPTESVLFLSFDFYNKFAAPVFDIIIGENDYLLSFFTKRFSSIDSENNYRNRLIRKILEHLDKALPLHVFKEMFRRKFKTYVPDYYLCSTNFLIPNKVFFTVKKSNRIIVHADDINKTVDNKITIKHKGTKYGVFLDQGVPFLNKTHPKVYKTHISEDYLVEYYKKLEDTFNKIKNKFNLDEIVVALHPDAVKFKKELKGKFSDFKTYIGVSHELVRDAELVLGHCSTALSFAVYYKKPVIILKDNFLINYDARFPQAMKFFIDELGMNELDMDSDHALEELNSLKIDKEKYNNYIRKFLKDNNIQENSYYYAIKYIENDLKEQGRL